MLQELNIGSRYSKAQLNSLLDERIVSLTPGIFYCSNTNAVLLFVTLEKGPDKPNYNDYFENSGKYFHWDSQKTQHINVPSIQNIVTGRTVPHLFVRLTEKSKSTVQPFTYFGSLAFESYDASTAKPVHIRFKVNNPIPIGQDEAIRTLHYWRPQAHGNAPTHHISDVQPSDTEKQSYVPPSKTERQGLVTSRVGQGWYRERLIELWGGRCPITGTDKQEILIASHIVPWKDATDDERLDPHNGILLSPNVDALFDRHLISFGDDGQMLMSKDISQEDLQRLGINLSVRIPVSSQMKKYLQKHRERLPC